MWPFSTFRALEQRIAELEGTTTNKTEAEIERLKKRCKADEEVQTFVRSSMPGRVVAMVAKKRRFAFNDE